MLLRWAQTKGTGLLDELALGVYEENTFLTIGIT